MGRFRIDCGAVITTVVSVCILSMIGLVANRVYVGSTKTTATTQAAVDVLITEVSLLKRTIESQHSIEIHTPAVVEAPAPRSVGQRVAEAVTFKALWASDAVEEPLPAEGPPEPPPTVMELESDIRQQIMEKTKDNR